METPHLSCKFNKKKKKRLRLKESKSETQWIITTLIVQYPTHILAYKKTVGLGHSRILISKCLPSIYILHMWHSRNGVFTISNFFHFWINPVSDGLSMVVFSQRTLRNFNPQHVWGGLTQNLCESLCDDLPINETTVCRSVTI